MPYLFDQLHKPAYRHAFDALFVRQPVSPWLKDFIETGNGVVAPGHATMAGSMPMEVYSVCQPHNCGGNFLYVLFTPGGTQAWAVFTKDDRVVRFYGNPDTARQNALKRAIIH